MQQQSLLYKILRSTLTLRVEGPLKYNGNNKNTTLQMLYNCLLWLIQCFSFQYSLSWQAIAIIDIIYVKNCARTIYSLS